MGGANTQYTDTFLSLAEIKLIDLSVAKRSPEKGENKWQFKVDATLQVQPWDYKKPLVSWRYWESHTALWLLVEAMTDRNCIGGITIHNFYLRTKVERILFAVWLGVSTTVDKVNIHPWQTEDGFMLSCHSMSIKKISCGLGRYSVGKTW